MGEPSSFARVSDYDDPKRCQRTTPVGQCLLVRCEGSEFCAAHAGGLNQNKIAARTYRLGKWQARMEDFADDQKIKSLREEIGICRMLLEEYVNKCNDATELLLYSGKISELVLKIEKLVTSCHRIEAATGMLIDKTAVINLAGLIVEIISRFVRDESALDSISGEIMTAILSTQAKESKAAS